MKALCIVCVRPNLLKYVATISLNQKMTQLSSSPYMVESFLEMNYHFFGELLLRMYLLNKNYGEDVLNFVLDLDVVKN